MSPPASARQVTPRRPRQFGLSALFATVTMYALLFGLLAPADDPLTFVFGVVFFTGVLLARVFLFAGRRPWLASSLTGAAFGIGFGIWSALAAVDYSPPKWGSDWPRGASWGGAYSGYGKAWYVDDAGIEIAVGAVAFAVVGLIAGAAIGGCFALARLVGRNLARREPTSWQRPTQSASDSPGGHRRTRGWAFGWRRALCLALIFVAGAGIALRKPLQVAYYRYGWESSYKKTNLCFMPLRYAVCDLFGWTTQYNHWEEDCRASLVRLGYFDHREFVFEHIAAPTPQSDQLWQQINRAFPHAAYYEMDHPNEPAPARLRVWDRPERIPRWEAFVVEHDVAEFDE